jgi:hypothetical protein
MTKNQFCSKFGYPPEKNQIRSMAKRTTWGATSLWTLSWSFLESRISPNATV